MKRIVKQGNQIINDVWNAVRLVTTVPVYKYSAPLIVGGIGAKEHMVVSLLSADAQQAYNALVLVNIHVPNIGGVYPAEERFQELCTGVLSELDYYSGSDFLLTTDVAGRMNRNSDGTFFYTIRFFYETIIKEI